ncbi:hypothetical protein EBA18_24710 (plasmid) [Xanthomonas oryzae pv. oryzae]|nr:hypothetical protein EBA18_24710 [Xanthomonas oryzae pv. oryzae]QEJ71007.1 hypothetical protein BXO1_024870 [Xanthomonas oryzae pv. oryzae]
MGLTDKNASCHSQYRLMSCHVIPPPKGRGPRIGDSPAAGQAEACRQRPGRHAENCLGHRSSSPGPRSCRQLHRRRCRRPGARSEGRQCVVRNP